MACKVAALNIAAGKPSACPVRPSGLTSVGTRLPAGAIPLGDSGGEGGGVRTDLSGWGVPPRRGATLAYRNAGAGSEQKGQRNGRQSTDDVHDQEKVVRGLGSVTLPRFVNVADCTNYAGTLSPSRDFREPRTAEW